MTTNQSNLVTLSKGGKGERSVDASKIEIPDLWHLAQSQDSQQDREAILEVWHLAHDLRTHIIASADCPEHDLF